MSEKNYVIDNEKLMSEWNWEENNKIGLNPNILTLGSNKKASWICSKKHNWNSMIINRMKGQNCPYCSNHRLLKGFNDLKTVAPHIAKEWNYKKNGNLTPSDIFPNTNKKVWWLCNKGHEWQANIQPRTKGVGCPYCTNQKILPGYNDLASNNPKIAKEWHPTKNGNLKPSMVSCGSGKIVWWKCVNGHEWQAMIKNRNNGNGCPICSGKKIIPGYNDLIFKYPYLEKEWDFTKNKLDPHTIGSGSNEKVWWKCLNCHHEWQALVSNRTGTHGTNCPKCSRMKIKK